MKYTILLGLLIWTINLQSQSIGMEINYGEYVDLNRMSGALVIDIDEDDWQLNIDDVNIQSTVSGYGGAILSSKNTEVVFIWHIKVQPLLMICPLIEFIGILLIVADIKFKPVHQDK